jgi:hypothetical protein
MFTEWEGELNFLERQDVDDIQEESKYYYIDKKEAKRFMNNCPLISVNEVNKG